MKVGVFDMPDSEYFAADGLNNSYLWRLINKTPAHAQVQTEKTDAMTLGSAVHLAVLQPELADKGIKQGPKDRRGKPWKEAIEEADAAGVILLTEGDYHTCMTMRDRVWQNPAIAAILGGGGAIYEQAAFFEYRGLQCKLKMDCAKDVLIDLKTSADASPRGFAQSVAHYGYHQQAASYTYGWNSAIYQAGMAGGSSINTFLFLVVEKSPPYAPAIYELDAQTTAEGWASYNAAIDLHLECEAKQHFHGYAAEKVLLSLPHYAFKHTNPREIDLKGVAI
jgi:hypothetical protein